MQDTWFETEFFGKRGDRLTDEQLGIQASPAVSLLIEAAAGAAKTTTLCLRICQALADGARPERLLVLTFTRTACTALRRTLDAMMKPVVASRLFFAESLRMFTIAEPRPSRDFSTTLPTKPSVTTTSTCPLKISFPSQ